MIYRGWRRGALVRQQSKLRAGPRRPSIERQSAVEHVLMLAFSLRGVVGCQHILFNKLAGQPVSISTLIKRGCVEIVNTALGAPRGGDTSRLPISGLEQGLSSEFRFKRGISITAISQTKDAAKNAAAMNLSQC